jgi:RNA polymerase sigma-70 factor (ECF subfamily)
LFFKKKPGFTEDNLESVIAACLKQDHQAQKALIRLFYSYAKSISLRYAGNIQESEEIMNDVFVKVFNNLTKYDNLQPFKAWLRTIIVNTSIDYYRKNQKYALQVDIEDIDVVDLSDDIISKISADEILSLIQKLPPTYRMTFTLYVIEGYNHREIANMMEIKEGTSKSNLQDARRKLQKMITDAHPHLHIAYALKHYNINEN